MNLNRHSFYDSPKKERETFRSKIQNIESMNDYIRKNTYNNHNNNNKIKFSEVSKINEELKDQNNYFMDFVTGNLSKIINSRQNTQHNRRFSSFMNLEELKILKKRASFIARNNYNNKINEIPRPFQAEGFQSLGLRDLTHNSKHLDNLADKRQSSIIVRQQTHGFNTKNYNIHHNKEMSNKRKYCLQKRNTTFNDENLINPIARSYDLSKLQTEESRKSTKTINTSVSNISSSSKVSRSLTISAENKPKKQMLHPRLSMRINQFLNELNTKTCQYNSNDNNYNRGNFLLNFFEENKDDKNEDFSNAYNDNRIKKVQFKTDILCKQNNFGEDSNKIYQFELIEKPGISRIQSLKHTYNKGNKQQIAWKNKNNIIDNKTGNELIINKEILDYDNQFEKANVENNKHYNNLKSRSLNICSVGQSQSKSTGHIGNLLNFKKINDKDPHRTFQDGILDLNKFENKKFFSEDLLFDSRGIYIFINNIIKHLIKIR